MDVCTSWLGEAGQAFEKGFQRVLQMNTVAYRSDSGRPHEGFGVGEVDDGREEVIVEGEEVHPWRPVDGRGI